MSLRFPNSQILFHSFLSGLLLVATSTFLSLPVRAQQPATTTSNSASLELPAEALADLDLAAQKLADEIQHDGISSVVVFGAPGPGDAVTKLGEELGDELSAQLETKARGFHVRTRTELRDFLREQRVASSMALNLGLADWVCPQLKIDAVVTATMEALQPDRAILNVYLFRTKHPNQKSLIGFRFDVPLSAAARSDGDRPLLLAADAPEKTGGKSPRCEVCDRPDYTPAARREKFQGDIKMIILVTKRGLASEIEILSPVPYGLEGTSIATVQKWRFKPATNKDGEPIDARVQVIITYQLFGAVMAVPMR